MPKKKKSAPQQPAPPTMLDPHAKDPILSTGPAKDYEDWKIKNARARELIMSTLVPGSEPWKIAEQFEDTADIWKALQARYDPKQGDNQDQVSEEESSDSKIPETSDQTQLAAGGPHESGFLRFWDQEDYFESDQLKNFYMTVTTRDQRLLWAVLHGGTPETDKWFIKGKGKV